MHIRQLFKSDVTKKKRKKKVTLKINTLISILLNACGVVHRSRTITLSILKSMSASTVCSNNFIDCIIAKLPPIG